MKRIGRVVERLRRTIRAIASASGRLRAVAAAACWVAVAPPAWAGVTISVAPERVAPGATVAITVDVDVMANPPNRPPKHTSGEEPIFVVEFRPSPGNAGGRWSPGAAEPGSEWIHGNRFRVFPELTREGWRARSRIHLQFAAAPDARGSVLVTVRGGQNSVLDRNPTSFTAERRFTIVAAGTPAASGGRAAESGVPGWAGWAIGIVVVLGGLLLLGRGGEAAATRPKPEPDPRPRPEAAEISPDDRERLAQLDREVTDPALYERVRAQQARLRSGAGLDRAELDALERAQSGVAARRSAQIDAAQAEATREWHARREERERAEAERDRERRHRDDVVAAGRGFVGTVTDAERRALLEDFLARHSHEGASRDELERAVGAIRAQTVEADQQRAIGESESARAEAAAWADSERYATRVRDWSARVNRGLAASASGARAVLAAPGAVRALLDLPHRVQAAAQGYREDGLRGAVGRLAASALDRVSFGAGTVVYEASRRGDDADAVLADYANNLRNSLDPTRVLGRLGRASSELVRGGGFDALGAVADAAFDARDLHRRAERIRRRLGDRDAEPERGLPLDPGPSAGGARRGPDPFNRSRDLAQAAQDAAQRAEARAAHKQAEAQEASRVAAEQRALAQRLASDAVRSMSRADAERMQRALEAARDAERQARRAGYDAQMADDQAQLARMNADIARVRWLDADPRRAAERATQRTDEANERVREARLAAQHADDDRRRAQDAVQRGPQDAEARAAAERASRRLAAAEAQRDLAEAQARDARSAEAVANDRVARHDARDRRVWERTTDALREHFKIRNPNPTGQLRIVSDRTEILRQLILAHPETPTRVTRVVDPRSGVEVSVDPRSVDRSGPVPSYPLRAPGVAAVDPATGRTVTSHERLPGPGLAVSEDVVRLRRAPNEVPNGFFDPRNRVAYSLPIPGTITHEAGHALTDGTWDRTYRTSQLTEGVNELLTQRFAADTGTNLGNRAAHYPEATRIAELLDHVTDGKVQQAFHDGRLDALHEAVGLAIDPRATRPAQLGAHRLAEIAEMMDQKDFTEATRAVKSLARPRP